MTTRIVQAKAPKRLLTRLLETPDLARVVQALEPKVLHQLVRVCGLEDCGEIVALATTDQLMRIFDDDLWRSDVAGQEEQFDADRFGLWLEVLAEVGVAGAAEKVVAMDVDFVTAALSRHVLVLAPESLMLGAPAADLGPGDSDPAEEARAEEVERALENGLSQELGGYRVVARRSESWDALLSVLIALEAEHHAFFSRLMRRAYRISNEYIEDNGGLYEVLTADEQIVSDVAGDRERRREEEGYVAPSQAAAFLKLARRARSAEDAPPAWDPVTIGHFRERKERSLPPVGARRDDAVAQPRVTAVLETLREGGVIPRDRPPLLLRGGKGDGDGRFARIRALLRFVQEQDEGSHSQRLDEFAYLANVLVAGCSFQSRRFRSVEAADAVLATCNLGLENWPPRWPSVTSPDFLLRHDLVSVFQTGWSVLYERVSLLVAKRLGEVLSEVTCDDEEVQDQLGELRRRLQAAVEAGIPWRERDNLDVIATLDPPSWATLLGLLDECPVVPKAPPTPAGGRRPLRVASGFEFISENRQIAWVREFVASLPQRLLEP